MEYIHAHTKSKSNGLHILNQMEYIHTHIKSKSNGIHSYTY